MLREPITIINTLKWHVLGKDEGGCHITMVSVTWNNVTMSEISNIIYTMTNKTKEDMD